ncbi:MAG: ABC transporter substrate-binding protein [Balneolaceae bacterium]|nr:ABC transporter substrate-binding protein [Balneolaceae bacterium]
MIYKQLFRWAVGLFLFLVLLAVLRFEPWQYLNGLGFNGLNEHAIEILDVGFLPVTCHLTCPVTDFASQANINYRYDSQRYTDFPTMVESIKSGRLEATFMIVPLAMKLREQGVPVKIVYLGHRDGSTVMVRPDLNARDLTDLRGRTFAIPSIYSNQNLVIRRLMMEQGIDPSEINFVELPPPDMPGALSAKAIDAYFVGEPFAASAELSGSGDILYHAKDIWPDFISCALVVHERLIEQRPDVVENLVRGIAESGEWAEQNRLEAAKIAAPYFRQNEEIVRHVLTRPPDRVSYSMLNPTDSELQRIHDMAIETGILSTPVPISELVDRSFIPDEIRPLQIN